MEIADTERSIAFSENGCTVVFKKDNRMSWTIADFTCGDRGRGRGKMLLLNALKHIKTFGPRNAPFRIELLAVPTSTTAVNNNQEKLEAYYESIGFMKDNSQGITGQMFGLVDGIITQLAPENAGLKRRKSLKRRK